MWTLGSPVTVASARTAAPCSAALRQERWMQPRDVHSPHGDCRLPARRRRSAARSCAPPPRGAGRRAGRQAERRPAASGDLRRQPCASTRRAAPTSAHDDQHHGARRPEQRVAPVGRAGPSPPPPRRPRRRERVSGRGPRGLRSPAAPTGSAPWSATAGRSDPDKGTQVGEGLGTDPRDLRQLVDDTEPVVRRPPGEDLGRGDGADPRQGVELLGRGRVEVERSR